MSKLDWQTYKSVFESHWEPHSYGLVPHLSKKLSKLLPEGERKSQQAEERRVDKVQHLVQWARFNMIRFICYTGH